MLYDMDQAMHILSRTPSVLSSLLRGLPDSWLHANEGGDTWSPFDVVGHLLHGEETDWIARTEIILEHGESVTFEPFDRFAQLKRNKGKSIEDLLDRFESLRKRNLETVRNLDIQASQLKLKGRHPELGPVTLGQLLSTWVVHDLGHIGQVARAMAKQYSTEVGPWVAYLRVLEPRAE